MSTHDIEDKARADYAARLAKAREWWHTPGASLAPVGFVRKEGARGVITAWGIFTFEELDVTP